MYYFLKKTKPTKKDTYLQIYVSYYDAATKSKKQKCHQSLGYVERLKTEVMLKDLRLMKLKILLSFIKR